jgi:hypothetical protein
VTGPVELVQWPAEAERRAELAAHGLPRLLVVAPGVAPPPRIDREEDWIRLPADERDVWSRLRRLAVLHERRRRRPRLTDEVVLVCGDRRVVVSPGDARLLGPLVEHFGELVLWDRLTADLSPTSASSRRARWARVARLRARIEPAGLVVHAVRGRGLLLDHVRPDGAS